MMTDKPPVPVEVRRSSDNRITSFLEHAHLFTPDQRERILILLENTILPTYIQEGKAPIEEEWLNRSRGVKVVEEKL